MKKQSRPDFHQLFTRKEIPTKTVEALDRISREIGGNESITADPLIGATCLKALEPLEVIPSQGNGPYAIRTALGWCVIGPIDLKDVKTISCNRIAVTEARECGRARYLLHLKINAKKQVYRRC